MIQVAEEFAGAARLGILEMDGVQVRESPEELKALLTSLADDYARRYAAAPLAEIPVVRQIRGIFHRSGLDPTRYRPSSESLLRRAVKAKGLYFINSVVDLINYFSLRTFCPMGLYDQDRLRPPFEWRPGREGETYEGIGRDRLNLVHFPLLADAEGPFGSLISDSMKTRVTEECRNILWITFAPPGSDIALDEMAAAMQRFSGGSIRTSNQYDV